MTDSQLDALLVSVADEEAEVVIGPPSLEWLFCPYDGGVDVILPDAATRDSLHDRHPDWIPAFMQWFDAGLDAEDGVADRREAFISAYQNHLLRLSELASDPLQELIATNLHDALVREWQFDGDEFRWSLITGDLQVGYELLTVVYLDAMLIGTTPAELTEFDLCDRRREMVSDELDSADVGQGRLEHRFEFWPGFVFGVQFNDVRITREPLAERRV